MASTVPVVSTAQPFVQDDGRLTQYGYQLLNQMRLRLSGNLETAEDTVYQLTSSYAEVVPVTVDVGTLTENTAVIVLATFQVGFETSTTTANKFKNAYRLRVNNATVDTKTLTYNYYDNPPSTPFEWTNSEALVFTATSGFLTKGENTFSFQATEGTGYGGGDTGFLRETSLLALVKR